MSYEDKYEQKGKRTYKLPCAHKKYSDIDGQKRRFGLSHDQRDCSFA
jgi:hypothetical protein